MEERVKRWVLGLVVFAVFFAIGRVVGGGVVSLFVEYNDGLGPFFATPWGAALQAFHGWRAGIDPGGVAGVEVTDWERYAYGPDLAHGLGLLVAWVVGMVALMIWLKDRRKSRQD